MGESKICRVISFDIGTKNFAYSISEFDLLELNRLRTEYLQLPKNFQRKSNGIMNEHVLKIMREMFSKGNLIKTECINLRSDDYNHLNNETRVNLRQYLDDREEDIYLCDYVLIEQQFSQISGKGKRFKAQTNYDALKFSECVNMYFVVNYPKMEIITCPAKNKTMIFTDKKMVERERKDYADEKVYEILSLRNDSRAEMFLKKRGKKKTNDMADTIIQLEAWKYKTFVAKF